MMVKISRRKLLAGASALGAFAGLAHFGWAKGDAPVTIVKGLDHPWGFAFLPDGSVLVTERSGKLKRIDLATATLGEAIAGTPAVVAAGQGGLLDVAVDPEFSKNRTVFLTFTMAKDKGSALAVYRGVLNAAMTALDDGKVIFSQNLAVDSEQHFGSRIVFDREGHLFVTTGDRGSKRDEAQNPATHLGKTLRITREGVAAPGNPGLAGWAPEVWSIGHRNMQGATLHPETGALWTVEHGARGGDEINTPQAGRNYGWPVISYGKEYSGGKIGEGRKKDGMEQPLFYWDPSIAPSGMLFYTGDAYPEWKGNLFVGALASEHVVRLSVSGTTIKHEEKLYEGFARFRAIKQGPDGRIYLLTDEGTPSGGLYMIPTAEDVTATQGAN